MHSQLIVINRDRSQANASPFSLGGHWIVWTTCVRSIAVHYDLTEFSKVENELLPTDQVYMGKAAFKFMLEVVCGLHSPVQGETEVHGQYKEVLEKLAANHKLYLILKDLHLKARHVRDVHLRGLGSQSYGSLARRRLKSFRKVAILGVGPLTREILPWLAKLDIEVELYSRNPERHKDLLERYSSVKIMELSAAKDFKNAALIVSAPVSSEYILNWVGGQASNIEMILDYRGESHFDPLQFSKQYFNLKDIFKEIENTKQKVEAEVGRAKNLIATLCSEVCSSELQREKVI